MPSLQGHKFINRERPRSQKPDNGLAYFASSEQAPQPVQRELLPMLLSRGFEESRPLLLDTRQWHELNPLLKRAESRPRSTTDPHRTPPRRPESAPPVAPSTCLSKIQLRRGMFFFIAAVCIRQDDCSK